MAPPHKQWCIEHDQVDKIAKEMCEAILKGVDAWGEPVGHPGVMDKRMKCLDALEGPILRYSPIVYDAAAKNYNLCKVLVTGFYNEVKELEEAVADRDLDIIQGPSFFNNVHNYLLSGSQIIDERGPDGKRFLLPGLGNSCAWPERVLGVLQSDQAAFIAWLEVVVWKHRGHYTPGNDGARTVQGCRDGLIGTIYALVLVQVVELLLHEDYVPQVLTLFKAMNEIMRSSGESGPLLNYCFSLQAVLRIQAIRLRSQAWADEHFSLEQMGLAGKKVLGHYLGKSHARMFRTESRACAYAFIDKQGVVDGADMQKWKDNLGRGLTDEQLCRLL
jgi:hypothetical protein